jgi:heptosyltransferase-2
LLVFSPNWLGDAVMALPAIDDLRRHLNARVVVAARPSVSRLFALVPWVDEIVELEWRSRVGDPGTMLRDIGRLRRVKADVALLLPNSFASAWLAFAARVPQRWGYATDGRGLLLTRAVPGIGARRVRKAPAYIAERTVAAHDVGRVPRDPALPNPKLRIPNPGSIHQGMYYQRLVAVLGASNGPLQPTITVTSSQIADARALLMSLGWDDARPLVVFAPGAAYGTAKRWWPTHYATLAASVIATHGAHVVLVGSRADAETTGEVLGMVPSATLPSVIDLAGRTTLEMLAAVLSLARVCVSNDSGAMHLAAAAGVPLAAIFGPTNELETSPLVHAQLELLIHEVSCRPCMLRECPIDHPCMRDLTPDRVLGSVTRLLRGETSA